ncbi:hypothetical protein Zm00014a_019797 [Zea mays]|uniref:Uncharacterized protein n=1 Tax=Zea mays TaxID=4577 RepID=A0A317YC91_MAIZE|nr:hypothetical protein Zm00014a_019797 [Zea mays]
MNSMAGSRLASRDTAWSSKNGRAEQDGIRWRQDQRGIHRHQSRRSKQRCLARGHGRKTRMALGAVRAEASQARGASREQAQRVMLGRTHGPR